MDRGEIDLNVAIYALLYALANKRCMAELA
jgi:hypothetical protein